MMALQPLAMSCTKDDLMKHLDLPQETYALMSKETDRFYKWLTSEKSHLKKNCKRKAPYDWSDIKEKSKDDAMSGIANGGNQYTSYYWNLATPTEDCPNWIARWFLYHKFRYRDGRNRNSPNPGTSKHPHKPHPKNSEPGYEQGPAMHSDRNYHGETERSDFAYGTTQPSESDSKKVYDPVRDILK